MGKRDKRVDAYIARSQGFAQPILTHIRDVVHEACPDVEETLKWGFPHFMHGGILCSMSSFKEHCALGFWKGSLIVDKARNKTTEAMGQFGRIASLKDLPTKRVLAGYVKQAVKLNDDGVVVAKPKKAGKKTAVVMPPALTTALKKNKKALAAFEALSSSHKREYIEWIDEAKRDETKQKRIATTLEWLSEGKSLNWKYQSR